MRHRRFLTTIVILSLPCVVAVGLWLRSYRPVGGYLALHGNGDTFIAQSSYGRLWLQWWTGVVVRPAQSDEQDLHWTFPSLASGRTWDDGYTFLPASAANGFGFHWRELGPSARRAGPAYRLRLLSLPYWSIVAGCAMVPLLYAAKTLRRRRRRVRGMCPACGYDVRATPDRCPECGVPIGRNGI